MVAARRAERKLVDATAVGANASPINVGGLTARQASVSHAHPFDLEQHRAKERDAWTRGW